MSCGWVRTDITSLYQPARAAKATQGCTGYRCTGAASHASKSAMRTGALQPTSMHSRLQAKRVQRAGRADQVVQVDELLERQELVADQFRLLLGKGRAASGHRSRS